MNIGKVNRIRNDLCFEYKVLTTIWGYWLKCLYMYVEKLIYVKTQKAVKTFNYLE